MIFRAMHVGVWGLVDPVDDRLLSGGDVWVVFLSISKVDT